MPDFFVPADTTGRSTWFEQLYQKQLIYQYGFQYSDQHRETLLKLGNAKEISDYLDREKIMDSFVKFAASRGVPADQGGLQQSGDIINTQLKAYIARNILGEEGFYPIIRHIDKTLLKAIEISRQKLLVENVSADTGNK